MESAYTRKDPGGKKFGPTAKAIKNQKQILLKPQVMKRDKTNYGVQSRVIKRGG